MAPKKKRAQPKTVTKSKKAAGPKSKALSKAIDLKHALDQPCDGSQKTGRPLVRRYTDEQTDRFVERKLSHISTSIIDAIENTDGVEA